MNRIKNILIKNSMIITLLVVFLLFNIFTGGRMVYPQNLSNLLLQNAYVFVMACGMLLCILTGGNIDLSVGSTVCLVGAIVTRLLNSNVNEYLVIIIALIVGALIGTWNGIWIGKIHVPSFVCTLASMFFLRGLARAILESKTIAIANERFLNIFASYINIPGIDDGQIKYSAILFGIVIAIILLINTYIKQSSRAKKGYDVKPLATEMFNTSLVVAFILYYCIKLANHRGIPTMVLWVMAVVIIYHFITSKSVFGRYFYAVGGNEKAAKLSGIDSDKVYFTAYLSMSVLAALAAMLIVARIGSVNGDTGNAFEMDAIGACFIGGASAYGGRGDVKGIIVGAMLLGTINQGMSIIGMDSNWQLVVKGLILLTAVVFDVLSKRENNS